MMALNEKRTITDAISIVLRAEGRPMTAADIYDAIVSSRLYLFKADRPVHVVSTQIRRHCQGLNFLSSSQTKYFGVQNGRYYLLETAFGDETSAASHAGVVSYAPESVELNDLQTYHAQYLAELKQRILADIQKLDPFLFEKFCRNLLSVYGFDNPAVTRKSRDGGIDGHGKLKVSLSFVNVAFQCKRRSKGAIGRVDIDQFRGAIQGRFELGIFFTTTDFTLEARENAFKTGAVPLFLINGATIVDIMLEKGLGIEAEALPVYHYNLDLAFTNFDE
jgi:restriction system protein